MASNGRRISVTLKEVADQALVSLGTASRVLNNHPNVHPDLRLRVFNAAVNLGYPLEKGRADYVIKSQTIISNNNDLSAKRTGENLDHAAVAEQRPEITHIAFCCPSTISLSIVGSYYSKLLHGVEAECRRQNLHLTYRLIVEDLSTLENSR